MLKKKNLSVILAVVLLCASVLGVLFLGAQAAGTKYYMTVGDSAGAYEDKVPADMSFIKNYDGVADAVAAAKGRTWAKGDTLTIYIANSNTTAVGSVNSGQGRQLFGTYTIFRADNTKLPITIDGDDPSTADTNEKYALPVGTFAYKDEVGVPAAICANDYTFKNLNLSSWAITNFRLYSGSGRVTFDTVTLGSASSYSGEVMHIFSQVPSQTAMTGWTKAKWEANLTDGLLDSSFTFINTTYGYNTGTVATRSYHSGVPAEGVAKTYVPDMTVMPNMFRNKIVIGNGAKVGSPYFYSKSNKPEYVSELADGLKADRAAGENVIEILDGATVSVVYGMRNLLTKAEGNNLICNVKGGKVSALQLGPAEATDTYTGNITINWTGGTVGRYGIVHTGTVIGNVYNNIKNQNLDSVTGLTADKGFGIGYGATATIQGSLYNNFVNCTLAGTTTVNGTISDTLSNTLTDCTLSDQVHLGAKGVAPNIVNTLSGTINTTDNYAYLGANTETITGSITNNIACKWVYTGADKAPCLLGGSSAAASKIEGKITNNILDGAYIGTTFIAGSNNGTVASIENYIKGGEVKNFLGGNSFNNTADLSSIKNVLTGGVIGTFRGASGEYKAADAEKGTAEEYAVVSKVENIIGQKNEDDSFSGDAHIYTYYGGAYDDQVGS